MMQFIWRRRLYDISRVGGVVLGDSLCGGEMADESFYCVGQCTYICAKVDVVSSAIEVPSVTEHPIVPLCALMLLLRLGGDFATLPPQITSLLRHAQTASNV